MKETTLQTLRSVKEREERLQVLEQRFPCGLWRDHTEAGCPLLSMDHHGEAYMHTPIRGGPHAAAVEMP